MREDNRIIFMGKGIPEFCFIQTYMKAKYLFLKFISIQQNEYRCHDLIMVQHPLLFASETYGRKWDPLLFASETYGRKWG